MGDSWSLLLCLPWPLIRSHIFTANSSHHKILGTTNQALLQFGDLQRRQDRQNCRRLPAAECSSLPGCLHNCMQHCSVSWLGENLCKAPGQVATAVCCAAVPDIANQLIAEQEVDTTFSSQNFPQLFRDMGLCIYFTKSVYCISLQQASSPLGPDTHCTPNADSRKMKRGAFV